ncbi:MAG: hypothetical protein RSA59_05935 [Raoultibacter sp.]
MIDAKWLYASHRKCSARLKVLELMLDKALSPDRDEAIENDLIEAMTFRRAGIDGMPISKHTFSDRTGRIALCKDEALESMARREAEDVERLRREQAVLIRYEKLFYATLDVLSETERELVLLHYDKGTPLSSLTDHKFAGKRAKIRTLSGLKTIRANAISKAQDLLGAV